MIFRKLSKVSWYKNFSVIVKNKSTTTLQCITQLTAIGGFTLVFNIVNVISILNFTKRFRVSIRLFRNRDHIRQQKNKKLHSSASLLAVNSLVSVSKHLYLT